jgi:hypothetical protein
MSEKIDHIKDNGVCNGCQMNTGGNNCEICASNYYSMMKDPNLVCAKCDCDLEGVLDLKEPCDRVKNQAAILCI